MNKFINRIVKAYRKYFVEHELILSRQDLLLFTFYGILVGIYFAFVFMTA